MRVEEVVTFGSRGCDAEMQDYIWQCVNVNGSRCEGYSDDEMVDCFLCSKFYEGIERRRKNREEESEMTINRTTTKDGDEFLLIDKGNFCSLVIGKRVKDGSYPDKFEVKETLNLSFADIVDLSTFFHFSGQAILGMKLPSRNIK